MQVRYKKERMIWRSRVRGKNGRPSPFPSQSETRYDFPTVLCGRVVSAEETSLPVHGERKCCTGTVIRQPSWGNPKSATHRRPQRKGGNEIEHAIRIVVWVERPLAKGSTRGK